MRVLLIKTSSMGDILHTLPALTDAAHAICGIQFDWVVEAPFQQIPHWHPNVDHVIPVALRTWRKQPFSRKTWQAGWAFCRQLRARQYDAVIDAQGLIKSALITRLARGKRFGLDRHSARESLASLFYQAKIAVQRKQHAVIRLRQLFAKTLGYSLPETPPDYGIDRTRLALPSSGEYLVFLHGTTWESKHWPETHWKTLAAIAIEKGFAVKLPSGNPREHARAIRIAKALKGVEALPSLDLGGMAAVLAGASGVVAVDTGLGHLAAALGIRGVSLYGPTNPALSGAIGISQIHLAAKLPPCAPCLGRKCTFPGAAGTEHHPPCLGSLTPERVWEALMIERRAEFFVG